jgi:hypothetical protein
MSYYLPTNYEREKMKNLKNGQIVTYVRADGSTERAQISFAEADLATARLVHTMAFIPFVYSELENAWTNSENGSRLEVTAPQG